MDLNQLWIFYNVAKHNSFSLAAESLFVTQPMISIKVKQLETFYKTRLFERFGKKIELTNAGKILFQYADKIYNIVKEADNHMEDIKGVNFGTIKISAGLTLGTYYLPSVLANFKKKYPSIEIQMKVKNKGETMEDILSFNDDIGFVCNMKSHEKLTITPLWEEKLVVIISTDHEFRKLKTIPLLKLNGQPFILREKGSGAREFIEEKLKKEGISVKVVMELRSDEAIKRSVEVGLGITIIPLGILTKEIKAESLKVIRLPQRNYLLKYYVIYHKDKYISPVMQAFLKIALEFFNRPKDSWRF